MGRTHRILAIWLACASVCVAAPSSAREHVVQPGQTLAKIAKRYRVDLDELCTANDLKKSAKLQPGLKLAIPLDDDRNDSPGRRSDLTPNRESRSNPSSTKKQDAERRGGARAATTSYSHYLARPARRGWIRVMGHHGEWQGQLLSKSGKLQSKAATALSRLLAWPRVDLPMDRRLLTLLAQVSDAFGGRIVRVVSGYRTTSYSAESKHPLGQACDFHVLGVPNSALRDFVRNFDNVGVGYYPNSTFIHLDVREYDAYWVDFAGPGEPPRSSPRRMARKSDDSPIAVAQTVAAMKESVDQAVAVMKETDPEPVNSEAQADMHADRQEHRDTAAQAAQAPSTSSTNEE